MIILNLALLFATIAGWSGIINRATKNYSLAMMLFPSVWICIGYTAQFFNLLEPTYYTFLTFGLAFFVLDFIDLYRKKKLQTLLPPEFLIFLGISAIWFLRMGFAYYSNWDNFSHWGIAIKELHLYNGLSNPDVTAIAHKDYPNGSAIFYYYFVKLLGYSEGYCLFANSELFTLFLAPLFYAKNRILSSLTLYAAVLLPSVYLNPGFGNLYVDHIIGAGFAACLIGVYAFKEEQFKLFLLLPLFISICLIKQVGGLMTNLTVVFYLLYAYKENLLSKKFICFAIVVLIIPVITEWSWRIGFLDLFSVDYSYKTLWNKLSTASNKIVTPEGFSIVLATIKYTLKLIFITSGGIFTLFILGVSSAFVMIHASAKAKAEYLKILKIASIIFAIYLLHRLMLYLSVFSAEEAKNSASFKRYYNTCITGLLGLILYQVKYVFLSMKDAAYTKLRRKTKIVFGILVILIAARLYKKPTISLASDRLLIREDTTRISRYLEQNKSIYAIFNDVNLGDCINYNYDLAPYRISNMSDCSFYATKTYRDNYFIGSDMPMPDISKFKDSDKTDSTGIYDVLYIRQPDQNLQKRLGTLVKFPVNTKAPILFVRNGSVFEPIK